MRTHYQNLKVAEDAPEEVIKSAWRALSQKHHPDKNPSDTNAVIKMQIINDAYAVLIDPEKRRRHDEFIKRRREKAQKVSRAGSQQGATTQESSQGQSDQISRLILWRKCIRAAKTQIEQVFKTVKGTETQRDGLRFVREIAYLESLKSELSFTFAAFESTIAELREQIRSSEWSSGDLNQSLTKLTTEPNGHGGMPSWRECYELVSRGNAWEKLRKRYIDASGDLEKLIKQHLEHVKHLQDAREFVKAGATEDVKRVTAKLQSVRFADLDYDFPEENVSRSYHAEFGFFSVVAILVTVFVVRAQQESSTAWKPHDKTSFSTLRVESDFPAVEQIRSDVPKELPSLPQSQPTFSGAVAADQVTTQKVIQPIENKNDAAITPPLSYQKLSESELLKLASNNDREAKSQLGHIYSTGNGAKRDYAKSFYWNQEAARQGSVRAQSNLGVNYGNGQGVASNRIEACAWWLIAADGGSASARANLKKFEVEGHLSDQEMANAVKRSREIRLEIQY